jgi:hypothetical protein
MIGGASGVGHGGVRMAAYAFPSGVGGVRLVGVAAFRHVDVDVCVMLAVHVWLLSLLLEVLGVYV